MEQGDGASELGVLDEFARAAFLSEDDGEFGVAEGLGIFGSTLVSCGATDVVLDGCGVD